MILHCTAPGRLLRERVSSRAARRNDASEAGLDVLARQPAYWEDFDTRERGSVLTVDTSRNDAVETTLAAIRSRTR
jgi:predicted kinase